MSVLGEITAKISMASVIIFPRVAMLSHGSLAVLLLNGP